MKEPLVIDFSGAGVAKSGTSWMAKCLSEHPQVCMAEGKETNYFTLRHPASVLPLNERYRGKSNYHLGPDWYASRYAHHEPGQLRGEFSVTYISDPDSPGLLREHNPDIKLIFSFRNPVDTLYSGYNQLSRVQPIHHKFEETLDLYPSFLSYVRHYSNLQPFLKTFSLEQMHFVVFEDIASQGATVYRDLCRFLGIDETFEPEALNRKVNPRTVLRSTFLRDLRCAISSGLTRTPGLARLKKSLWHMGLGKVALAAFKLNERPGTVEPLRPEIRQRLVEEYASEVEGLGRFLGRDLSAWLEVS